MAEKRVVIGDAGTARGTCVLGGRTRIVVPVVSERAGTLAREVRTLAGHPHDLLEWRVDAAQAVGEDLGAACDAVLGAADVPVLATVRTLHEGGRADLDEEAYPRLVSWLAGLVDAVDVEVARPGARDLIAQAQAAGARVVASAHDFSATPGADELMARLEAMASLGADVAKIACTPRTPGDVLAVLDAQAWALEGLGIPVIVISMGTLGAPSRIVGSALGCAATFATVGESSAPGQLTAEQVRAVLDALGG